MTSEGKPTGDARPPAFSDSFAGLVAGAGRLMGADALRLILLFALIAGACTGVEFGAREIALEFTSTAVRQGIRLNVPLIAWVTAGGLGVSVAALFAEARAEGAQPGTIRGVRREVLAAALFASVVALVVTILTGSLTYYYLFLLPLFFGPPVVVHVITFERLPLRDALGRARELIRGNGLRMFSYFFSIALLSAIMRQLLLAVTAGGVGDSVLGIPRLAVLIAARTLYDGASLAYLAAFVFAIYVVLRAREEDLNGEPGPRTRDK